MMMALSLYEFHSGNTVETDFCIVKKSTQFREKPHSRNGINKVFEIGGHFMPGVPGKGNIIFHILLWTKVYQPIVLQKWGSEFFRQG